MYGDVDRSNELKYDGEFEDLLPFSISGWAIRGDLEDVSVDVYIDGKFAKTINCDAYRADLPKEIRNNGFFSLIDRNAVELSSMTVEVFYSGTDITLPGSPKCIEKPSYRQPDSWFFMHIPKSGGTTLRGLLESKFPRWNIMPLDQEMVRNGRNYPNHRYLIDSHRNDADYYGFLRGHYHIDVIKMFKKRPKLISVFRDPIERCISALDHILSKDHSARKLSVDSFVDNLNFTFLSNVQTRYLGHRLTLEQLRELPPLALTVIDDVPTDHPFLKPDIVLAKERLWEIDHIMLTDTITEDISKLGNIWNTSFPAQIEKQNVSRKFAGNSISPEAMEKLYQRNALDIELFEEAKKVRSWKNGSV